MAWWRKVVIGALGLSIGGPIGGLLGVAVGYVLDKNHDNKKMHLDERLTPRERTQAAFFSATFSIMGYVARADGQVSMDELIMADSAFDSLGLSEDQRLVARQLFNRGKNPDFPVWDVLNQFRIECRRQRSLYRAFITIQIQLALSDGQLHPEELSLLRKIASKLLILPSEFDALLELSMRASAHKFSKKKASITPVSSSLASAYKVLNASPELTDAEVKSAYRRMMHQHHPDKLISRGLPEEMILMATEKAKEIQHAWAVIKKERPIR